LPSNITYCIEGSNDAKILMHHYNITKENLYSQFESFSKTNFLDVHYKFTNMSAVLNNNTFNESEKYSKLAEITN
jgi:hypothetical protein